MDLDPSAEEEERLLEDENEAEDARHFIVGCSAAAAIDVEEDGAGAGTGAGTDRTATGSTSPTTASTTGSGKRLKRRDRPPTSRVWADFEEVSVWRKVRR